MENKLLKTIVPHSRIIVGFLCRENPSRHEEDRLFAAMFLENIVVDGFKSYATRTVIAGLDPHFNAITGLNGSGKSNILDSICFVLGISNLTQVRLATPLTRTAAAAADVLSWWPADRCASAASTSWCTSRARRASRKRA